MDPQTFKKMSDKRKYKISIKGIIRCGKTKLLKYLENIKEVEVAPETVENWENWDGVNILDFFYRNPGENSFILQTITHQTTAKS